MKTEARRLYLRDYARKRKGWNGIAPFVDKRYGPRSDKERSSGSWRHLGLVLPPSVYAAVKVLATQEEKSLAAIVREAVTSYLGDLEEKGKL